MPFFDDSGIVRENHRGPIVGAFATFADQVERMVAVSIAWSVVLFPALAALGFPGLPGWFRVGLVVLATLLVAPATTTLYALAARATRGEQLDLAAVRTALRATGAVGLRVLAPLYAGCGALTWLVFLTAAVGVTGLEVVLRVGLLCTLVVSSFWAPLAVVRADGGSAWTVLRDSVRLTWRRPGTTAKAALAVAVLTVLAVVTVAGAVLAAPVLIALIETQLFEEIRDE